MSTRLDEIRARLAAATPGPWVANSAIFIAHSPDDVACDGIKLAAAIAPEHAAVIDNLKDQLLVVFLKRLEAMGHPLKFPVSEIDDTGQDMLSFSVDPATREFRFTLGRKQ